MTKRIIALLVAAIMAVSCCMLVACEKEPEATTSETSKTSETPVTSEPKTSETSEPKTSETSEPSETSEEPSEPVVEGDGFFGSIEATEVMVDLYSTGTPWENWNGRYQAVPQLYKEEVDATENVGTEDYEWVWNIYAAPADENGGNVQDEASFQTCQGEVNTVYDFNSDDGKVIYRLETGSFTKDWVVGTEYEVIIVVSKGDEKFKGQLFVEWTEESAKCWNAWCKGLDGNGDSNTPWDPEKVTRHIPSTCPCEFEEA